MLILVLLLSLFALSLDGERKQFWGRWLPLIWGVSIFSTFLWDGWLIYRQYEIWAGNELTRFLLPEYNPGYFPFYAFFRFLASDTLALIIAVVMLVTLTKMNNRAGKLFFEEHEPYLASTVIFLVGFPGLLFYLVWLLLAYLLWHLLTIRLTGKASRRLPLYSVWPLVGVVTVLVNTFWLEKTALWLMLIFSR